MFLGHFAVGLAVRPVARGVSLGTLFLAAQWLDLLWPTLLLAGVERVRIAPGITAVTPLDFEFYPYSHSLAAALAWALLAGGFHLAVRRTGTAAAWAGFCLFSHWLLDWITHRPDLPLVPGSPVRTGLGLWNSMPATVVVELAGFALAVWFYHRGSVARSRTGSAAFWGLIALLIAIYIANLAGPPPPERRMIAWVGQAQWLLVAWGYWIERNRRPRTLEG